MRGIHGRSDFHVKLVTTVLVFSIWETSTSSLRRMISSKGIVEEGGAVSWKGGRLRMEASDSAQQCRPGSHGPCTTWRVLQTHRNTDTGRFGEMGSCAGSDVVVVAGWMMDYCASACTPPHGGLASALWIPVLHLEGRDVRAFEKGMRTFVGCWLRVRLRYFWWYFRGAYQDWDQDPLWRCNVSLSLTW